jgi:hypothetical protein
MCDGRAKLGEGAEVVFSLGALCFLPERTPATDRLGDAFAAGTLLECCFDCPFRK